MSKILESTLTIRNDVVKSIFQTLGTDENDLSYSLGYVLSRTPLLLRSLISRVYSQKLKYKNITIKLQEHNIHPGFTDFEIHIDDDFFCIVEAKKGWTLPSIAQLKKYRRRFIGYPKTKCLFVVLSDCKEEYCKNKLKKSLCGVNIKSITWADVVNCIEEISPLVKHKEKYLLNELDKYLREVINMETKKSNMVWVVSLGSGTPSWSKISWRDIVNKKARYFYPSTSRWPKTPDNYIAFRYNGRLQSIHCIEKYEIVDDVHKYIPEIRHKKLRDHYLLWLGKGFEPRKELPSGKIWSSARMKCMLDTLFTSKTIKEAGEITKARLKDK